MFWHLCVHISVGADMAANASVQVDAAKTHGILIANGEFTSFVDPNFGHQVLHCTQQLLYTVYCTKAFNCMV